MRVLGGRADGGDAIVATWSRRLSAAQAKQPGTTRRPDGPGLPDTLPADILTDDQSALLAVGAVAKDRPGFVARVRVRRGTDADFEEVDVEVAHDDAGVHYSVAEPEDGGTDRVVEMLTDTLVITSDIVAIFASVGAEALWANDAFATAIPIREADKIWLIELLDEWSKGHFEVNVLPALVQHGRWHGRLVLQPHPDDPELPVLTSLVAHRDPYGEIEAVTMVARDLRPLHASQARIDAAGTQLAALVEHAADIIVVVDSSGRVLYASPATTRMLAMSDGGLDGSPLLDRVHPEDAGKLGDLRHLAEPDEDGIPPSVEVRLRSDADTWRIVELVASDLSDNPAIGGVVLTARDVTDRVEAVQRLADRAYTDPLTLLPNRMRLLDRLGKALGDGAGQVTVVLLFDIDRFHEFNDAHGHAAGDELLRQLAHRLADETRPQDVVARLAGNTFAMVMRSVTDIDGALVAADRIKGSLGEPYRIGADTVAVTVSVGIAVATDQQTAESLLADADRAVGIAKDSGGDRVEVLTADLRSSAAQRSDMEALLHRALTEHDGIQVHYQPVFDVESGDVVAAEALLRIHDDEGALLNPASFLEAAEDTGLIGPIGGQVLQLTCQQIATWGGAADPGLPAQISVNVSPRQLSDPGFAAVVGDAIEQAGIDPGQLGLEITESQMIGDRGIIDDTVAAVRDMGVAIGLDDFGAGQSSLGYLKRFSLDFVKIDRELVGGLGREEGDTAIVRATIELAHSLGLLVVAVGVETEEQLEILRLLGADRAQGFYFAPAVPADQLASAGRVQPAG
jgi:diguanylate cyclase (GGDEF)-like protein/PAS domain S-box-containing protein